MQILAWISRKTCKQALASNINFIDKTTEKKTESHRESLPNFNYDWLVPAIVCCACNNVQDNDVIMSCWSSHIQERPWTSHKDKQKYQIDTTQSSTSTNCCKLFRSYRRIYQFRRCVLPITIVLSDDFQFSISLFAAVLSTAVFLFADWSTRRIGYFDRIDEIDLFWSSHTDSDLSHFHLISCVHVLLCSPITCLTHDYKCFGSNKLRHRHEFSLLHRWRCVRA